MFKVLCSGLLCHTVSIMCDHHVCLSVVLELASASLTRERGKCCRSHRSAMHAAKKKPQHSGPKNVAIPCRTKFHCNSAACFRQGLTHSRCTTHAENNVRGEDCWPLFALWFQARGDSDPHTPPHDSGMPLKNLRRLSLCGRCMASVARFN